VSLREFCWITSWTVNILLNNNGTLTYLYLFGGGIGPATRFDRRRISLILESIGAKLKLWPVTVRVLSSESESVNPPSSSSSLSSLLSSPPGVKTSFSHTGLSFFCQIFSRILLWGHLPFPPKSVSWPLPLSLAPQFRARLNRAVSDCIHLCIDLLSKKHRHKYGCARSHELIPCFLHKRMVVGRSNKCKIATLD